MGMSRSEAGRKGGNKLFQDRGPAYMAEIGAKGFASTVARHWQGDRAAYRDYLGLRRHEQRIEEAVDAEMARRLTAGAKTACVELPVICDPDDDPTFLEGSTSWRRRIIAERAGRVVEDLEIPF